MHTPFTHTHTQTLIFQNLCIRMKGSVKLNLMHSISINVHHLDISLFFFWKSGSDEIFFFERCVKHWCKFMCGIVIWWNLLIIYHAPGMTTLYQFYFWICCIGLKTPPSLMPPHSFRKLSNLGVLGMSTRMVDPLKKTFIFYIKKEEPKVCWPFSKTLLTFYKFNHFAFSLVINQIFSFQKRKEKICFRIITYCIIWFKSSYQEFLCLHSPFSCLCLEVTKCMMFYMKTFDDLL